MTNRADDGASYWHLDKRVPIALIVTIFIQSAAVIWWASAMQTRLANVENRLSAYSQSEPRIVRLEQIAVTQSSALVRIENKLDRVIERESGRD